MTQERLHPRQRSRQAETIGAFLTKRVSYSGSVQSDGSRLYSYLTVIGEWDKGKIVMPCESCGYCRTTTKHRNILRDMATSRGIEITEVAVQ
jgi:hypothetical protein